MDPAHSPSLAPDLSVIPSKINKKNMLFCDFFMTFIFENDVNVALKSKD
jgi:hypothetical protein